LRPRRGRRRRRAERDARADCLAKSGQNAGPSKARSCAGHRGKGPNHL